MRAHWPQLDVVRFLAFLMVFLCHGVEAGGFWVGLVAGGGFGVDVFFVLSSYLITKLLSVEHQERGKINVGAFWVRRALRIWPLYFLFIVACVLMPNSLAHPHLFYYLGFLGNWACVFYGYPESFASPLWSVSVEEQFYLGWPILLLVFGMKNIRWMAGTLIAVGIISRGWLAWSGANSIQIWCNTLSHLDAIGIGALLALYWQPSPIGYKWLSVVSVGIIALAGILGFYEPNLSVFGYTVVSLAGAGLIVSIGSLPSNTPGFRVLGYLGRISYGLYVFHTLCIALGNQVVRGNVGRVGIGLLLTIAMAAASYHYFERPFLKLKQRWTT
jgi:peptidoglycan/LPS O-acetylase OafA/YrhL